MTYRGLCLRDMSSLRLSPVHSALLSDQVIDTLRDLIASGDLRSGERLVETHIASQLQVSRGPVRDAFRQLRAEGLLRDMPRRGTYVASLSAHDACGLLDLRAGLEARAARLVVALGEPEAVGRLRSALDAIEAGCRARNIRAISSADFAFHDFVCELSRNPWLHSVFVRHATELRVLLRTDQEELYQSLAGTVGRCDDLVAQHHGLVDRIESGDADLAEAAFRIHVEETRDHMVSRLRSAEEPIDQPTIDAATPRTGSTSRPSAPAGPGVDDVRGSTWRR
jgi:GntR family transcriptional regulator, gluconate operon transcriptional repressor